MGLCRSPLAVAVHCRAALLSMLCVLRVLRVLHVLRLLCVLFLLCRLWHRPLVLSLLLPGFTCMPKRSQHVLCK